jgi:hypothetical protein
MAPNYKLNKTLKITARTSAVQQLDGGQKSALTNTRLSLQHSPIRTSKNFTWFPTVFTDLPTNVEDRKLNSYRGNIAAQTTSIINARVLKKNYSVIPIIRGTKNFHGLERNAGDSANISHTALGALYIETGLAKKLSLSVGGSYIHAWTYQDSTREQFSLSQELTYDLNKQTTVTLGHSNDASVFAANGQESNVKLFDENSSSVYINVRGIY